MMARIRVACQTYTWEMLGNDWRGKVTDLLDWIAEAGYEGIEITNTMIREFAGRPQEFADELAKRKLHLAAFAYATTGFTDSSRREEDLAGALQAIEFLRYFSAPRLGLGGAAASVEGNRLLLLDRAIEFYNEVGRRAVAAGVRVNVHPHSHHGSLLETAEEYRYLLERLDTRYASFGPDTGHIVRGGQDLVTCLRTHLSHITHLHLKDATTDGKWAGLGEGVCDFPGVFRLLESAGYQGWVVGEEESEEAWRDGRGAIRKNRAYLHTLGY
jgi:sugar phosphate isomerase/epimerase